MTRYPTFEKLIIRKDVGFVCDETSMVKLAGVASFETSIVKLTTKIESCLLLLTSHTNVDLFTIDVVELNKNGDRVETEEKMTEAWQTCEEKGCHGLITLAHIDSNCMPNNGSRVRYSLAQFVDSLVHGIEAYFMFQKFSPLFTLNAAGLWDAVNSMDMDACHVVLAWKLKERPQPVTFMSRLPLSQLNTTASAEIQERIRQRVSGMTLATPPRDTKRHEPPESKRQEPPVPDVREELSPKKRGRPSRGQSAQASRRSSSTTDEEEDDEVTFKVQPPPVKIPEVTYSPDIKSKGSTKKQTPEPEPIPTPEPEVEAMDITFGFESGPKTPGRKSTAGRKSVGGRKSLMPDWPQEEKDEVINFFDTINPKQTEQARIALACKFASMKYDRELPSKLLYQWIQKKGRVVYTPDPGTSYDLPEAERKGAAVYLFKSLNPDHTEASRVAFTCKFFQTQYGVALQSKQLYDMLADKGKKTTSKGRRR